MEDEEFYLTATKEVDGEKMQPALWSKAIALAEGNQEKAKYKYIKLRVKQLIKEKAQDPPVFTKKTAGQFNIKYMSVPEFSKIKSIPEKEVIKMIKEGVYIGGIKNDKWYVSRDEIGKEGTNLEKSQMQQARKRDTKNTYGSEKKEAQLKDLTPEEVPKSVGVKYFVRILVCIVAITVYGIWRGIDIELDHDFQVISAFIRGFSLYLLLRFTWKKTKTM